MQKLVLATLLTAASSLPAQGANARTEEPSTQKAAGGYPFSFDALLEERIEAEWITPGGLLGARLFGARVRALGGEARSRGQQRRKHEFLHVDRQIQIPCLLRCARARRI